MPTFRWGGRTTPRTSRPCPCSWPRRVRATSPASPSTSTAESSSTEPMPGAAPGFGFTLPQRGVFFGVTTVAEMLALAAKADANPLFGSVWVGDSLLAKPRPDSIALLGALAAATRRVTLGVGCMASFPVRDPVIFAYQWATLDLLSAGRMLLAACTGIVAGGASAREGALWGVADREHAARPTENIDICRRLWSEDDVTFTGR